MNQSIKTYPFDCESIFDCLMLENVVPICCAMARQSADVLQI